MRVTIGVIAVVAVVEIVLIALIVWAFIKMFGCT
jgi:hypothetical protein